MPGWGGGCADSATHVDATALRWDLGHSEDILGGVLLADGDVPVMPAMGLDDDARADGVIDDSDAAGGLPPALRRLLDDAQETLRTGVRTVPVYIFSILANGSVPATFDDGSIAVAYGRDRGSPPTRPTSRDRLTLLGWREGSREPACVLGFTAWTTQLWHLQLASAHPQRWLHN